MGSRGSILDSRIYDFDEKKINFFELEFPLTTSVTSGFPLVISIESSLSAGVNRSKYLVCVINKFNPDPALFSLFNVNYHNESTQRIRK